MREWARRKAEYEHELEMRRLLMLEMQRLQNCAKEEAQRLADEENRPLVNAYEVLL